MKTLKDTLIGLLERVEKTAVNKGSIGILTGLHDLDKVTQGLFQGDLWALVSRPSMAKMDLINSWVLRNLVEKTQTTFVFCLAHHSPEEIGLGLLAAACQVDKKRISRGTLGNQDWPKIAASADKVFKNAEVFFENEIPVSLSEKFKSSKMVFIVDDFRMFKGKNENEVFEFLVSFKKQLSSLGASAIVLQDLSMSVEKRPDKRPWCSDIADPLLSVADVVLGLYQHEQYDSGTENRGIAELILLKSKDYLDQIAETLNVAYITEYGLFANLGKS